MKREMDLSRKILQRLEEKEGASGWLKGYFEGYSDEQVSYHIKLLYEANLIEAIDTSSSSGFCWEAKNLTWDGHEFLEASRSDTVWNSAKDILQEKGVGMPFEILKQLLVQLAKDSVFG